MQHFSRSDPALEHHQQVAQWGATNMRNIGSNTHSRQHLLTLHSIPHFFVKPAFAAQAFSTEKPQEWTQVRESGN
jgi:hypothetical protein